jgi:pimeloyl-ACP methyl ester carboxylesterase
VPLLDIPSGPIAYDERGSGQPIVLLPSGAHDRHDFDELRELISARLRSTAIDWPAHGESPPDSVPTTAMHLADVAERAIELLAPDGAIVLGSSVGGFAAARLAIRRPELVKALVIVDGGGFAGRPPHVRAFCGLMGRSWFLRRIYPLFAARYMRAKTPADKRALAASVKTTRQDPGLRAVSQLWRSFASPEHDLRRDASSIAAPTLLIWGRHDPVIPARIGRKIKRAIPQAQLVILDSGHLPHTSQPEQLASHLISFLDRSSSGRVPEPGAAAE